MSDSSPSILDRTGLDLARATSLVSDALQGADDGELYLEYSQSEGLVFDNGRLKSASFDTNQGFGLRAVSGEAAGYAHSGEISESAIKRAADAVQAVKSGHTGTYAEAPQGTNRSLYSDESPLGAPSFADKVKLLEEIDAYARQKDDKVRQVTASLAGSYKIVEILRADGRLVRDIRPLVRVGVNVVVGDGDKQESGSHGMGGREGFERFVTEELVAVGRRRGAAPGAGQPLRRSRPRRHLRRRARPRLAGHPAPRGGRPRPRGRFQPQGRERLRRPDGPARRLSRRHRHRRRHPARPPRLADRRRRRHADLVDDADRGRHPRRLHAGPAERPADGHDADRQRPPRILRPHPDAADDQHHHALRHGRSGRGPRLGQGRHLRRLLRRRPGRHHLAASSSSPAPRPTASRTA